MTSENRPWRVTASPPKRLLDDFFKIDEVHVSYEQFDGKMSDERRLLIFERGDAVAALLHDPERRKIIAVNQFRIPTREKGQGRGWLVEAVAGMIRTDKNGVQQETPEQCLKREVLEETGYQLTNFTKIAKFFSSPGGSTEIIHLYYASVRQLALTGKGGGVKEDGEDIEIVEYDIDEFLKKLNAGEFEDPKLIIAGQWFAEYNRREPAEFGDNVSRTFAFEVLAAPGRIIGIKTGNIKAVNDVEVWINSENSDMMMDRFFGNSVSATIRGLGAKKDGELIIEDTIGRALAAELGNRNFVEQGTVIRTTAGSLERSHNVKQIFHVATVSGRMGKGLETTLPTLKKAMRNVLRDIAASRRYSSAVTPIFGTGHGGVSSAEVAPALVDEALEFFKKYPRSKFRELYFLAYSAGDLERLQAKMQSLPADLRPLTHKDKLLTS